MGNKVANKFSIDKSATKNQTTTEKPPIKNQTITEKSVKNKDLPVTPLQSGAGYTTCLWNEKEIKKMVYSKQIAPLYVGNTELIENR